MGHEEELRRAAKELEDAKERRDHVIVQATEAGMTRRAVAEAVGLDFSRVQQIVAERRKR